MNNSQVNMIIVGAGPRSLALALQASLNNISTVIIDESPLSTWTYPNIMPDIIMRSPITFDFTTYIEELQDYSLSNFLGIDYKFSNKQKEIENNTVKVSREQFISYSNYIYSLLKHKSNISFIKSKVISIGSNYVETNDASYTSDNIVIAIGTSFSKLKIPYWVDLSKIKQKIVSLKDLLINNYSDKKFIVLGSGQGAAETAYHLSKQNKVYWCLNKPLRVYQYPVPDYNEWRNKSALGSYYKGISSLERKQNYLKEVKGWQPSITPYIKEKLDNSSNIEIIMPKSTSDMDYIFSDIDFVIINTGFDLNVLNLPFKDCNIKLDDINSNFPKLTQGFKSVSERNIYFTGAYATMYDGPRQNSLISSAITAKEIIENILN